MIAWLKNFLGGQPQRLMYAFCWRMSDRKRFTRGTNGLYMSEDGEYLTLVTSQALERGEKIEGEIYLLSNDPRFSFGAGYPQVPHQDTLSGQDGMLRKLDIVERIDQAQPKNQSGLWPKKNIPRRP